jgi:hypothetical protein
MIDHESTYSDSLLEVFGSGIQFRKYYFPIGGKFVRFSDILAIEKKPLTLSNGKWRLWGTGNFTTWFPKDWCRPKRSCIFLLRLGTQKICIGFTVENPEKFMEVMKTKGVEIQIS